jgi:hypothetical protein
MLSPSWTDFLSMLAQAAVALLALLFVSFQIARDRWITKPARQFVAIQTLLEFLTPSFFAIIALLPVERLSLGKCQLMVWQIGGALTSVLGLLVSLVIIRYGMTHQKNIDGFFKNQLRLQPIAVIEYSLILVFSIAGSLTLASAMMIWLLLSGSFETWLFFAELD